MTRNHNQEHDLPPAKARTRIRDRVARSLRRVADRLTPRTFRAKLTIAISVVFLIALGSAAIVQTVIINGMFSYAMTISYENGQDGGQAGQPNGGDNTGQTPSDDDFLSVEGWSVDPDPRTWQETHQQPYMDAPQFLGSASNGEGSAPPPAGPTANPTASTGAATDRSPSPRRTGSPYGTRTP